MSIKRLLSYKTPTVSQLLSGHVRGEWHIRHMSHSGSLLDTGVHVVCRYIALAVTGSSVCFRALLNDLNEEFTKNQELCHNYSLLCLSRPIWLSLEHIRWFFNILAYIMKVNEEWTCHNALKFELHFKFSIWSHAIALCKEQTIVH